MSMLYVFYVLLFDIFIDILRVIRIFNKWLWTLILFKTNFFMAFNKTQLARNIPGIFTECSLSVVMFRASREYLENILNENIWKSSRWKSCFCVKSIWFDDNKCWSFGKFQSLEDSVSRIFEEHSRNFCFKNIPRISPEYCKIMNMFLWSLKT